ncbi:MAG: SCO family protein [bacterium]|jgi:protein SCO1/2
MSVFNPKNLNKLAAVLPAGMIAIALAAAPAPAQIARSELKELEGVGITEHLDEKLPLDLQFTDETGRQVKLADYFSGNRPVILTLVYYECPMLCSVVLNGMIDALSEIDLVPGRDYDLLTVSFNPLETPTLARLKKQNYLKDWANASAGPNWHFLTGGQDEITALTSSVGFGYKWNEERKEYAHSAALILLTPDGRISRYLYGVMYEPRTLRLSLLEAGEGKIGSPMDQIILYCFHYDPSAGAYTPQAINIMRAAGLLTLVALGGFLGAYFVGEARRARAKSRALLEGPGR